MKKIVLLSLNVLFFGTIRFHCPARHLLLCTFRSRRFTVGWPLKSCTHTGKYPPVSGPSAVKRNPRNVSNVTQGSTDPRCPIVNTQDQTYGWVKMVQSSRMNSTFKRINIRFVRSRWINFNCMRLLLIGFQFMFISGHPSL